MPTPASHSLDELEFALDATTARMQQLFDENTRLRKELAEASEHMRTAGQKLRLVAERLPQAAVSADASDAAVAKPGLEKAA